MCRWPSIKNCERTAPRHEHPIINSLGCMCWSSFVDCNVSISMIEGLQTPYKDEHGLALLQLCGRLLQSNGSSKTIATCYTCTLLNLSLLRVSTNVVLSEQISTKVGLYQWYASRDFASFVEDLRQCSQTQRRSRQISLLLGGKKNDYWGGLLPRRNHISKVIQMFTRIGLITCSWPPYNTTIPYDYYAFVWHPYIPYISRQLQPLY